MRLSPFAPASSSAPRRLAAVWRTLRAALRVAPGAAVLGTAALAAGCKNDINLTNPNQPTTETLFTSAANAQAGLAATYAALLQRGMYQRWWAFAYDARSDIGTTTLSPWGDLANFGKTVLSNYNFEVNIEIYAHTYSLIQHANQVITQVPGITMDVTARNQIVGEAKFLRGLAYWQVITLYGPNAPLVTAPVTATDRPASSDSATMFAQIEKDFTEAAAALPKQTSVQSAGRATAGAAQGMLGKTLLQERKWAAAAAALKPVIDGQYGAFALEPGAAGYARLFTAAANFASPEVLFEVGMGSPSTTSQGVGGMNVAKMSGACGPGYCDGRPTKWFEQQFFTDSTTTGQLDPRLDVSIFRYKGDTTMVYGKSWRYWRDSSSQKDNYSDTARIYWKKYGEYYLGGTDQSWDANINYKVLRYADVLLMYAEALNEQNQTAAAAPYVNQVRARVGLQPVSASLSQAQMRAAILHERVSELGFEGQRWMDLGRQNLFADLPTLRAHDTPDFSVFQYPRSILLPIPTAETSQNPNVKQNPGY